MLKACPGRETATKCASSQSSSLVLPFEDLSDRVSPRDEEQIGVWPLFPEVSEGVDRVRRARAVDVDPAHREPRIGGCGDRRHEVAMLCL